MFEKYQLFEIFGENIKKDYQDEIQNILFSLLVLSVLIIVNSDINMNKIMIIHSLIENLYYLNIHTFFFTFTMSTFRFIL